MTLKGIGMVTERRKASKSDGFDHGAMGTARPSISHLMLRNWNVRIPNLQVSPQSISHHTSETASSSSTTTLNRASEGSKSQRRITPAADSRSSTILATIPKAKLLVSGKMTENPIKQITNFNTGVFLNRPCERSIRQKKGRSSVLPRCLNRFLMSRQVYVAGKLVPAEQATVSVFDHGLLYGDGIFEGIRVYGGRVFLPREHIDRLYESALAIRLEIPLSHTEMTKAVEDTVRANGITDGYVRLVVTRGSGSLGLDIRRTSNPQVIVIADTISLYPPELYETGMRLVTAATIRNHPGALSPRIKSLNYLNNIMAKIEGTDAGTVEALMLNHNGEVAECTGDNIFIIKRGVLKTPQPDAGILEGITRNAVMKLAVEAGIPVQECVMTRHDIFTADECFLTGTAAEVIAVTSLDGRQIGTGKPGPITNDLLERFRRLTRGE